MATRIYGRFCESDAVYKCYDLFSYCRYPPGCRAFYFNQFLLDWTCTAKQQRDTGTQYRPSSTVEQTIKEKWHLLQAVYKVYSGWNSTHVQHYLFQISSEARSIMRCGSVRRSASIQSLCACMCQLERSTCSLTQSLLILFWRPLSQRPVVLTIEPEAFYRNSVTGGDKRVWGNKSLSEEFRGRTPVGVWDEDPETKNQQVKECR